MRLKTLAVFVTAALAIFTLGYWLTDTSRRASIAAEQEEDLLQFGEVIFSDDPSEPAAAGCARCHGPEGLGGPIPNDPNGRIAPSLHTATLAAKLKENPDYVHLAVSFGGVVVSGDVNSPMPAWSYEVGGPLNEQQIDAVVALVEMWATEAGEAPAPSGDVANTVEAGAEVYAAPGSGTPCSSCHGPDLAGVPNTFPNIQNIGSELVTDLPVVPSGLEQMQADYEQDPRLFLEKWIRDSAGNYNGGTATGMPPYPEDVLPEDALQALITFLLEGDHGQ
jgi:mono/diheme cytochrome c family protein